MPSALERQVMAAVGSREKERDRLFAVEMGRLQDWLRGTFTVDQLVSINGTWENDLGDPVLHFSFFGRGVDIVLRAERALQVRAEGRVAQDLRYKMEWDDLLEFLLTCVPVTEYNQALRAAKGKEHTNVGTA